MISKQEAVKIHQLLIRRYGGIQGIRDLAMLESALERPLSGIENEEFYPSPEEKAAAIIESIVKNHPFHDGIKRTGYVLMRLTLILKKDGWYAVSQTGSHIKMKHPTKRGLLIVPNHGSSEVGKGLELKLRN